MDLSGWVCLDDVTSLMNNIIMLSIGICRMSRDTIIIMNKSWSTTHKHTDAHSIQSGNAPFNLGLCKSIYTRSIRWYLILATAVLKWRQKPVDTYHQPIDRLTGQPTDRPVPNQFNSNQLNYIMLNDWTLIRSFGLSTTKDTSPISVRRSNNNAAISQFFNVFLIVQSLKTSN